MSNGRWALLDRLQRNLKGPHEITTEFLIAVANRLEEAVTDRSRVALDTLKGQLADFLRTAVRTAPQAVAEAALGRPGAPELRAAYMLGQVGFAQMMAAQIAERRPDANVISALQAPPYIPYLRALGAGELTGLDLVDKTGERAETVSRKLRALRDLGLVEFRREGVNIYNSLTSFARAAIEDAGGLREPDSPATAVQRKLRGERERLDPIWQTSPSFSQNDDRELREESRSFEPRV